MLAYIQENDRHHILHNTKKTSVSEEADMNELSVHSTPRPMPTGPTQHNLPPSTTKDKKKSSQDGRIYDFLFNNSSTLSASF